MLNGWVGSIAVGRGVAPAAPGPALGLVVERDARRLDGGSDQLGGNPGVEEEQGRVAVGDHGRQALRRRRRSQRRYRHARAQRAQEGGRIGDRRRGADGDAVPRREAIALQGRGDAVHQPVQLGVEDHPIILDQGGMIGAGPGMLADQLGDDDEIFFKQVGDRHGGVLARRPGQVIRKRDQACPR